MQLTHPSPLFCKPIDPRGFQLRSGSIRLVSAVNFRCSLGPVPVPPPTTLSAVASARVAWPAIKNNDDLYAKMCLDRVQTRKMRQMIRKVLISSGILMLMSASVATQDLAVMGATALTLGSSVAAYKHAILDGCGRDGGGCVPMSLDCFEVREVPGKGMGLFTASHIPKDRFLMQYEGERINDLEFELRYADNPFSDKAGYVMRINDDEFIDGSKADLSGYARYMNHAKSKANVAKFISQRRGGACSFFALRDIRAGEELLIDYSDEYWIAKGIVPIE